MQTSSREPQTTDLATYRWAAIILRTGMYASFAAMALGLIWWLALGAPGAGDLARSGVPFEQIFPELFGGNPLALLDLGILILLVTPGITLLVEIGTYIAAQNWRYAAIGTIVALILLLGVAIAFKWIRLL